MKKISTVITIILVSFVTTFAKTTTAHAVVAATTTSEFPHSFSLTNTGSDTLTIEFVVVDCAGIDRTSVHLYVNSGTNEAYPTKHTSGALASIIRHNDLLTPNTSRNLNFVFGVRVPQSAVTVSVMVRNQHGQRYYICCTGGSN